MLCLFKHISKLKTLQNHYQQRARAPVEQNDLLAQHRSWAVDQHFQMHTILNMVVVPTPVVARHVFGISRTQIQEPVDYQNDFLYYLSLWDLECVFLIACCVIQASQPHRATGASRVSLVIS